MKFQYLIAAGFLATVATSAHIEVDNHHLQPQSPLLGEDSSVDYQGQYGTDSNAQTQDWRGQQQTQGSGPQPQHKFWKKLFGKEDSSDLEKKYGTKSSGKISKMRAQQQKDKAKAATTGTTTGGQTKPGQPQGTTAKPKHEFWKKLFGKEDSSDLSKKYGTTSSGKIKKLRAQQQKDKEKAGKTTGTTTAGTTAGTTTGGQTKPGQPQGTTAKPKHMFWRKLFGKEDSSDLSDKYGTSSSEQVQKKRAQQQKDKENAGKTTGAK